MFQILNPKLILKSDRSSSWFQASSNLIRALLIFSLAELAGSQPVFGPNFKDKGDFFPV